MQLKCPGARGRWKTWLRRCCGPALVALAAGLMLAPASLAANPPSGGGGIGAPGTPGPPPTPGPPTGKHSPFAYRGMWLWYVSAANNGNLGSIVASARSHGIRTLFIKSGDGSGTWAQFNPGLVSALHASGLRVCAWQFVYGDHPLAEANVGAAAVRNGADCLVIDAESAYEGKYVQAQVYVNALRKMIGASYPLGLAGFPYVDYHPAFPYSVFLGAGGAQFNAPQMYWYDIGTSVDEVYAHTYAYNDLYGRPIYPLGQVSSSPPGRQIVRFRQMARVYGAGGVSWWDWQDATPGGWHAVAARARALAMTANPGAPMIQRGDAGDLVVWAQEHLLGAGITVSVTGRFDLRMKVAVAAFQLAHGLPTDGVIGAQTWPALLSYPAAPVTRTKGGARIAQTAQAFSHRRTLPVPQSASLPARHDEIPGSLGSG
ncbi:MAG: peptidoglycan-binding protein [Actinomycetota bacterium]|nr:peptidoglycan-binding protein [Actinomycetota bacterium]